MLPGPAEKQAAGASEGSAVLVFGTGWKSPAARGLTTHGGPSVAGLQAGLRLRLLSSTLPIGLSTLAD